MRDYHVPLIMTFLLVLLWIPIELQERRERRQAERKLAMYRQRMELHRTIFYDRIRYGDPRATISPYFNGMMNLLDDVKRDVQSMLA